MGLRVSALGEVDPMGRAIKEHEQAPDEQPEPSQDLHPSQEEPMTKSNEPTATEAAPEQWRKNFGLALTAARKAHGFSQQQLGQQLRSAHRDHATVVQATVSSWEAGITTPSAAQLFALEKILGVDLCTHLGRMDWDILDQPKSVAALIATDPYLSEQARPVVLATYLAGCIAR